MDLYFYSYRDACYGYTYEYSSASFNKYANDYFYALNHTYYWGEHYEEEGSSQIGELLNASSSVDIRFVVEDDGSAYGGSTSIQLYSYPFDYSWD